MTYFEFFSVFYTDTTGTDDCRETFTSEDAAEEWIEYDLQNFMAEYPEAGRIADFGDRVDFWVSGQDFSATWYRLWKNAEIEGGFE